MRKYLLVLTAAALAAATLPAVQAAPAKTSPGLRMYTVQHRVPMVVHHFEDDTWTEFNPTLYLGSARSRFQVDVRRANASSRISATVRVDGRTRKIPSRYLDGWNGFKDAFTLTWRTPAGTLISRDTVSWCPNYGQSSRLNPQAASETAFTWGCSAHPFTRGQRWGVDRGWVRQVLGGFDLPVPDQMGSRAVLEVQLRWALARRFGLTNAERIVTYDVPVTHVTEEPEEPEVASGDTRTPSGPVAAARSVHGPNEPTGPRGKVSKKLLPDLVSLPAYGISTHSEDGRDLLDFAATVFNGGPGPLVAEGFRRGSRELMGAYQFFYRGEKQVASRKVGTMEFDNRPSHLHWHFHDFAVYDLVNARHQRLRTSGKEAFCLAPTDAINLLLPGAVVDPGNGDLATACGEKSSVWVREVLAAGWGDTYTQQRAGQSIDITGLRNGTYWIRIVANPVKRLYEVTRKNNVSLRRVILGGAPGDRTVTVPRYGLIDSEKDYFGGGGPVG